MKRFIPTLFFAAAVSAILLAGCNQATESESEAGAPPTDASSADESKPGRTAEHAHGSAANEGLSPMEKMEAELTKLSPEDAAAARKQHICPVSGEMLGVMGPPIKVTVEGQDVWICCEGCRRQLLDNPDEFLAKLNG